MRLGALPSESCGLFTMVRSSVDHYQDLAPVTSSCGTTNILILFDTKFPVLILQVMSCYLSINLACEISLENPKQNTELCHCFFFVRHQTTSHKKPPQTPGDPDDQMLAW